MKNYKASILALVTAFSMTIMPVKAEAGVISTLIASALTTGIAVVVDDHTAKIGENHLQKGDICLLPAGSEYDGEIDGQPIKGQGMGVLIAYEGGSTGTWVKCNAGSVTLVRTK